MSRIGRLLHTANFMAFPRHFRFRMLNSKTGLSLRVLVPGGVALLLVGCGPAGTSRPSPPLVAAARRQIGVTTEYDPAYVSLAYPGGDVPLRTGVCCDVVIRAARGVGVDLQREVHEDMRRNFRDYPKRWALKRPNRNIDHRRVQNLARYFERHHVAIRRALDDPSSYRPGDIVTWDIGRGMMHIGIVSDRVAGNTPLILHNIGRGTREENMLFRFPVRGHYRLKPNPPPGSGARPAHNPVPDPG